MGFEVDGGRGRLDNEAFAGMVEGESLKEQVKRRGALIGQPSWQTRNPSFLA